MGDTARLPAPLPARLLPARGPPLVLLGAVGGRARRTVVSVAAPAVAGRALAGRTPFGRAPAPLRPTGDCCEAASPPPPGGDGELWSTAM